MQMRPRMRCVATAPFKRHCACLWSIIVTVVKCAKWPNGQQRAERAAHGSSLLSYSGFLSLLPPLSLSLSLSLFQSFHLSICSLLAVWQASCNICCNIVRIASQIVAKYWVDFEFDWNLVAAFSAWPKCITCIYISYRLQFSLSLSLSRTYQLSCLQVHLKINKNIYSRAVRNRLTQSWLAAATKFSCLQPLEESKKVLWTFVKWWQISWL